MDLDLFKINLNHFDVILFHPTADSVHKSWVRNNTDFIACTLFIIITQSVRYIVFVNVSWAIIIEERFFDYSLYRFRFIYL